MYLKPICAMLLLTRCEYTLKTVKIKKLTIKTRRIITTILFGLELCKCTVFNTKWLLNKQYFVSNIDEFYVDIVNG